MKIDFTKIKKDTVIRTVLLFLALVNQILTSTGHPILPFTDDMVTQLITLLFTIVTAGIAYWKNNSLTVEAIKADEYMKKLKKEGE